MSQELVTNCKLNMEKRIKTFENELRQTRTGRASVSILDAVRVDYYGTPTPISQVATISTPDARTVAVAPFEKKMIGEIEKSIRIYDIGVNPTNDGNVIRLPFPPLTEDRRKDIVKGLKKVGEDVKVALRLIRREANEAAKKLEKDKKITEDEFKKVEIDIQKITDQFVKNVDEKLSTKEREILTL